MSKDITVQIEATHLGPHFSLKASLPVGSLQIGIFATNGMGKTFISRPLRLMSDTNPTLEDSNRMLTLAENNGSFRLSVQDKTASRQAEVKFSRNGIPVISNSSGYLFHVFNRDYLKENLEELKYRPNGEIEGYILGKEKIDLSKEKAALEKLKDNHGTKVKSLQKAVETAKGELDKLGIRKNTAEYTALTYENLRNESYIIAESDVYEVLLKKHSKLKSMPDTLPDLVNLQVLQDNGVFVGLLAFLRKEFSKSKMAEQFKAKIRSKQSFIEEGIGLLGQGKANCPFCEQGLQEKALKLIDLYVQYFADEEARQIKVADQFIKQLLDFQGKAKKLAENVSVLNAEFERYKTYLPSAEGRVLKTTPHTDDIAPSFNALIGFLNDKKGNISATWELEDINGACKPITDWIVETDKIIKSNDALVFYINEQKNNLQSEKLQLNRRLCKSKFLQLRKLQSDLIAEISRLEGEVTQLEGEVHKKEQTEKIDKKAKVIEMFESLLKRFFSDKYQFDKESFCLKFQKNLLAENASDVLSDGEKNIVAFCFFLSETFTIVNAEEDYSRLFFIIDDPISSLDFHYVYAVAQCLRSLDKLFGIERIRYIILTHHLEFMSILIRNNIVKHKFLLSNGGINDLKRDLIMPYEEHLRDIFEVARGVKPACHTTANSIRHVIETINKFVSPDLELQPFCETINGFRENAFLYSLMHDSSHGGIRCNRQYLIGQRGILVF